MKPVLFIDFDGTICFDWFWRTAPQELNKKIQKYLFQDNKHLVREWMRGEHTSEDINHLLAKECEEDYDFLWEIFTRDCKAMNVSSEVLQLVTSLRKKYQLVLITGNMDCFGRFTVPVLGLDNYFDQIINSSDEGQLKTENEGESFKKVCRNLSGCILIEDSQKSCDFFEKLGGKSYKVSSLDDTLEILKKLNS